MVIMRTLVFALTICGLGGALPRFLQRSVGAAEWQLSRRIPAANPEKYRSVRDAKDWLNPYIIVRADGIEVIAKAIPSGRPIVDAEDVRAMLLRLPVRAWPTDASWPRKRTDCALPIEAMMNRSNGITRRWRGC